MEKQLKILLLNFGPERKRLLEKENWIGWVFTSHQVIVGPELTGRVTAAELLRGVRNVSEYDLVLVRSVEAGVVTGLRKLLFQRRCVAPLAFVSASPDPNETRDMLSSGVQWYVEQSSTGLSEFFRSFVACPRTVTPEQVSIATLPDTFLDGKKRAQEPPRRRIRRQ